MLPLQHGWKVGQHYAKKTVHLRPARRKLRAKKSSLEVSQFTLLIFQPNHTILAFPRRFHPFLNRSGATYYGLGKTRVFVFCKIGILWSSLRVNFLNVRFEDFPFFRIIVNILRTKKFAAEDFFYSTIFTEILNFSSENFCVWPKIFFFVHY